MSEFDLLQEDGPPFLLEVDNLGNILLELQPQPPVIVYTPMRLYTAPIPNAAYYNTMAEFGFDYATLIRRSTYPWAYQQQGQGASSGPIVGTIPPP